ncbi:unnamed protein product [Didymodactylos carnosus]|uniref:Uncharacterized protein n=1 Tax=Didymodactylos carnosus TaxID=1234261 RepID=A0A815HK84_9BILA|nr:unnamed protein product [Didymodactylos carnosus]CAF4224430.1 unnamed protein product [Didymodactylos carnosus]
MPFGILNPLDYKKHSLEFQQLHEREYHKFIQRLNLQRNNFNCRECSREKKSTWNLSIVERQRSHHNHLVDCYNIDYYKLRHLQLQNRNDQRRFEYERIQKANFEFGQRLIQVKGHFSRKEHDDHWQRHCDMKKRLQKYPTLSSTVTIQNEKLKSCIKFPTDIYFATIINQQHDSAQKKLSNSTLTSNRSKSIKTNAVHRKNMRIEDDQITSLPQITTTTTESIIETRTVEQPNFALYPITSSIEDVTIMKKQDEIMLPVKQCGHIINKNNRGEHKRTQKKRKKSLLQKSQIKNNDKTDMLKRRKNPDIQSSSLNSQLPSISKPSVPLLPKSAWKSPSDKKSISTLNESGSGVISNEKHHNEPFGVGDHSVNTFDALNRYYYKQNSDIKSVLPSHLLHNQVFGALTLSSGLNDDIIDNITIQSPIIRSEVETEYRSLQEKCLKVEKSSSVDNVINDDIDFQHQLSKNSHHSLTTACPNLDQTTWKQVCVLSDDEKSLTDISMMNKNNEQQKRNCRNSSHFSSNSSDDISCSMHETSSNNWEHLKKDSTDLFS